jgi:H+-translocating NAD(P) transhydrogenase subunit alpha
MPADAPVLTVGVPKEPSQGEHRVAVVPADVRALKKSGYDVVVEAGAGAAAGFPDAQYTERGAHIAADRSGLDAANVIVHVRACAADPQQPNEIPQRMRENQILIAICDPMWDPAPMAVLAERKVTTFALELLPRITRAQSMDVLSSMATIAGYKGVLLAAVASPQMFPMMMTAAGTLNPAKVFVVGAGVAGLQAISTARRLGAVVSAYDVRPAAREQILSVGGKPVDFGLDSRTAEGQGGYARAMDEDFYRRQREAMAKVIAVSDVVITTASIPGQKAPVLISKEMVAGMAPGSVLVDLAAERGGNCEITRSGETIDVGGVTVIGPVNLASTVAHHASQMFSRNVAAFLVHLRQSGLPEINLTDEIVRETIVTRRGEVVHPKVRDRLGLVAANTTSS